MSPYKFAMAAATSLNVSVTRRPLPIRADGAASAADLRIARAFRAHRDRLASLLIRSGLGTGDADDVAQEAFWVLARRIADVPLKAERAYLTSTALRLASDRRRSVWHGIMARDWTDDDWSDGDWTDGDWTGIESSPEELCANRGARRRLDAALSMLGDDEREVFILVEVEGLSRSEAAHLLHTPPGTVASRLARARRQLDAALETLSRSIPPQPPSFGKATANIRIGSQRFLTNAWGETKAQGTFEQRLIGRRRHGVAQTGWYWHWPGFEPTVFAYPEVLIGWKPWDGGETTDVRLPVRVRKARNLALDYGVETRATGRYNLAISTWLTSARGGSRSARPEIITTELMVWPDYSPGALPPGRFVGEVTLVGDRYELWVDRQHSHRFPGDREGWTVLTLRGVGGRVRGRLALGETLVALASRGFVSLEDSVSCVELGNEVMGGAGTTFVEEFSVSL